MGAAGMGRHVGSARSGATGSRFLARGPDYAGLAPRGALLKNACPLNLAVADPSVGAACLVRPRI